MPRFFDCRFWGAGLAATALLLAAPASGQGFPVKMTGQHGNHFKGRGRIAIPSYSINYIVAQQATAAGGGFTRARLASQLAGVEEDVMRSLVNEAHADLKAQLAAGGIPLASDAEARNVLSAAGVTLVPGNRDDGGGTGGITIGKSVKKAFVSFGAEAAPLTDLYPAGGKITGIGAIMAMGRANKLNRPAEAIDATLMSPSLTVDFAQMEANSGSRGASASGAAIFTLRMESPVNIQNPGPMGTGTPGIMRPQKDYASEAAFAAVETGGGEVRAMSSGGKSRGDAVVVDQKAWSALVRQAYRSYNAAIVAAVRQVRGGG